MEGRAMAAGGGGEEETETAAVAREVEVRGAELVAQMEAGRRTGARQSGMW